MQCEGKREFTRIGLSPDPNHFKCEDYPELSKLKRNLPISKFGNCANIGITENNI